PIAQLITPSDVANASFNMACRVTDLVANALILVPHMNDTVQWRNSKGKLSMFLVSKAWEDTSTKSGIGHTKKFCV
ncbi:hypothetical protein Tco_0288967, partial [Tanacetum coccineum]